MNNVVPRNEELVNEIKKLLQESIPDDLIGKHELHKKLLKVLEKAMCYNDNYIETIIKKIKDKNMVNSCTVEIILDPDIQKCIENVMQRCIEIYRPFNRDKECESKKIC